MQLESQQYSARMSASVVMARYSDGVIARILILLGAH